MYYADIALDNSGVVRGPGTVRRIRYIAGNQPPVIDRRRPTRPAGSAPHAARYFTASATDAEGNPLTYMWDFGDGITATLANTAHIYTAKGPYTARLTVSDGQLQTFSNPIYITVGSRPVVTVTTPMSGTIFRAGDVINFSGIATDATARSPPPTTHGRSSSITSTYSSRRGAYHRHERNVYHSQLQATTSAATRHLS